MFVLSIQRPSRHGRTTMGCGWTSLRPWVLQIAWKWFGRRLKSIWTAVDLARGMQQVILQRKSVVSMHILPADAYELEKLFDCQIPLHAASHMHQSSDYFLQELVSDRDGCGSVSRYLERPYGRVDRAKLKRRLLDSCITQGAGCPCMGCGLCSSLQLWWLANSYVQCSVWWHELFCML